MILFKKFIVKSINKKLKAMQQSREHNQPTDESIKKEIALYHSLIKIYSELNKKKHPFSQIMVEECLRTAAALDDIDSQYRLGKHCLDEAKFRTKIQKDQLLSSQSNENKAQQLFNEALAYLENAGKLGHIQAKRLHGLCYINGWGVVADGKKGFDLVVSSIEQEGSWDKVPQIFAEIGLNKPEFFSALVKIRNK